MTRLNLDALEDDLDLLVDPGQRRSRNLKANHKPKVNKWEVRARLVERSEPGQGGHELFLSPSVNVTGEEGAYLFEQLSRFYEAKLITGVLRRVKGGKEANVYCCAAPPKTGMELMAAKVYRPRQFRNLRNDAQYRQGRPVLDAHGNVISQKDWRAHKAIQNKTRFGVLAAQTSWVEYEFLTLKRLHEAGADVPRPFQNSEHALLMEYLGEVDVAAPTLHLIALERAEAQTLFERLLRNVEIMLAHGVVHGDLSAYNVLYWEGEVKIIDFPQMVDPRQNPEARSLFNRDVERLCQYFARFGVKSHPAKIAEAMWARYVSAPRQALRGGEDEYPA